MTQVLVAYFSATGNTKNMAEAVVEGVRSVEGVECVHKKASQVSNDDWLAADGIIVGSPICYRRAGRQGTQDSARHGRARGRVDA